MNLCDAIDEFLGSKQNSLTHKSYTWYTQRLTAFENFCRARKLTDLSQITAPHVQQFLQTIPSTNTYTRHGYVQVVKGFLNWCSQEGVRERVVRRIELPKVEISEVEIFTDSEIMKLFRACERMPFPHRAKALTHLLLDTGLRASEICYDGSRPEEQTGLRVEHLVMGSVDDSYVWVMGKGRKSRTVGLGNETRMALKRYLLRERGRNECEYVFMSRKNEPLSVRMLEQFIKDLGEESGVDSCYPHRFRHTFAVNQLMQGTSDLVLSSTHKTRRLNQLDDATHQPTRDQRKPTEDINTTPPCTVLTSFFTSRKFTSKTLDTSNQNAYNSFMELYISA